jgi:hypothetical protein
MQDKKNGIDFVIIWVDGNDQEWLKEKNRFSPDERKFNINNVRYRDWDILHYLFRGIEKFAPWVRKVHFVTCGHVPQWLNLEHPKLNFVKHSDYISEEYLPTFSANPIELNLHRIEDLADRFVFFNDDMLLTAPVTEQDFFEDGLPRNIAVLNPPTPNRHGISTIIMNDLGIIADHFSFTASLRENWKKWFHLGYGPQLLRTLLLLPWRRYLGFLDLHLPNAFLKQTFREVWEKEYDWLDQVSSRRFRSNDDLNQWVMCYWQIASGNFYPGNPKLGKVYYVTDDVSHVAEAIRTQKWKMVCVNDSEKVKNIDVLRVQIAEAFDSILGERCAFEK